MRDVRVTQPSPRVASELLYDAVALGMWAYSRGAFQVSMLGGEGMRLRRGLLLVCTHRSNADVPIVCSSLFFRWQVWRQHRFRLHFAARDDLFDPGFFAAVLPSGTPSPLRRLVYPRSAARGLTLVRVHQVRSGTTAKLGQALAAVPSGAPLDEILPPSLAEPFRARATTLGLPRPRTAANVLRGEFADLLWRTVAQGELPAGPFRELWQRRVQAARADVRELIALISAGEPLLFFPEGRPSPDGAIGPLRPGLNLLVRAGRPETLVPLALAYDPLTAGRTGAYLGVGQALSPPAKGLDEAVLRGLRLATPLSCGQVVAHRLVEAALADLEAIDFGDLDLALRDAAEAARSEGRPTEPALLDRGARLRRLSQCMSALVELGLVARDRHDRLAFAPVRVLASDDILRLAREYASARAGEVTPASLRV